MADVPVTPTPDAPIDSNAQVSAPAQTAATPSIPMYDISGKQPVLSPLQPDDVTGAVASGTYSFPQGRVDVITPDNQLGTLDATEAPEAFKNGYKYATQAEKDKITYGTPAQQTLAGVEALGQGLVGPVSPMVEAALTDYGVPGLSPEEQLKRARANPITHYAAEAAGLVAPAVLSGGASVLAKLGIPGAEAVLKGVTAANEFTQAGVLEKAGEAAKALTGLEGAGLLKGVVGGMVSGATQMAILQSGDEITRMIQNDPDQSVQSAVASIGLQSLIGAAAGGVFGSFSPLWRATFGKSASQKSGDFAATLRLLADQGDRTTAVANEIQNVHDSIINNVKKLYGGEGLQRQAIETLTQKITPEQLTAHTDAINKLIENAPEELKDSPLFQKASATWQQQALPVKDPVTYEPLRTPAAADVFDATNQFKRQLQDWGQFDKRTVRLEEQPFRSAAANLSHDVRVSLENPDTWGDMGNAQREINKVYSDIVSGPQGKPSASLLGGVRSKFMQYTPDGPKIDYGKVDSFLNAVDKQEGAVGKATMRSQSLGSLTDAQQQLRNVYNKWGAGFGMPALEEVPTPALNYALQEKTSGMRAAEKFVRQNLGKSAALAASQVVGGFAGRVTGIGEGFGALLGEHTLGPMFSTVLPAFIRPMLTGTVNGEGFMAASRFGLAVREGAIAATKASKSIFKAGGQVLSQSQMPTDNDIQKLKKSLDLIKTNPETLINNADNSLTHFAPLHAQALSKTAAKTSQYLNSIAPNVNKQAPLDSNLKPNPVAEASYKSALKIAQQPLIVVDKLNKGTLVPDDIKHLNALYPNFYQQLQQKIHEQMIEQVNKGKEIPYQKRLMLSMFQGQAMDSTMTPQAIISAQPVPKLPPQPPAPVKTRRGTSTLGKMPNQYKTSTQEAEEDRQRRD
jgi:hypothetical protein